MKPLSHRIRADLFLQLSRLERAGIAYGRAAAMMALPPPAARRVNAFQALAAQGIDSARAGEQSGLFTKLEARLIRAALNAGSPAATYQRLADYHTQRAMQWTTIKSRLMLPAFVVGVSLFVPPLPALVSGAISPAGYAWQVISQALMIVAIVVVVRWLATLGGRRTPLYGPIYVRANLRDFFESLALMLEAGVPMLEALPAAIDTVSDADIRRALTRVRQHVEQRETFARALEGVPYLEGSPALAFAHTGEQSGTLPEMLMRYAATETKAIMSFYEQVAAWLPRIVYLLVALKVAAGIFSSGIVGPRVPQEL